MNAFAAIHVRQQWVKHLVDDWLATVANEKVFESDLRKFYVEADTTLWYSLERFFRVKLPSKQRVAQILEDVDSLKLELFRSVHVVFDDKKIRISDILRNFSCNPVLGSDFSDRHDFVFRRLYSAVTTEDEESALSTKTLFEVREVCRVAVELATTNKSAFHLCAHFLVYPSRLFMEAFPRSGSSHSFEILVSSVTQAQLWLSTVFGSESHYAGVVEANTILLPSNSAISFYDEMLSISKCPLLDFSEFDIERFEVASKLCSMSHVLKDFIHCCDHYEFLVSKQDTAFQDLRFKVGQFYEKEPTSVDIEACVEFFKILCSILRPTSMDCTDLTEAIQNLHAVLPLLKLFSTISRHPDVWSYLSERDWFGEDGLKRFYEEYGNVTNVLLGESASYEMSLLDCVEPVVRLLSQMKQLSKSSVTISQLF